MTKKLIEAVAGSATGEQLASGDHSQIWVLRSDSRWSTLAERHKRERKGVTPLPHSSAYFNGYGYAFPARYFATLEG